MRSNWLNFILCPVHWRVNPSKCFLNCALHMAVGPMAALSHCSKSKTKSAIWLDGSTFMSLTVKTHPCNAISSHSWGRQLLSRVLVLVAATTINYCVFITLGWVWSLRRCLHKAQAPLINLHWSLWQCPGFKHVRASDSSTNSSISCCTLAIDSVL